MRGMILAAGRGERMGALTATTPKPLLRLGNFYLIEYSLHALVRRGVKEIVINICYLGEQIKSALGDGSRYGVALAYSEEKEALETGGGIYQALPLLGANPFIVLSADVVTDFPLVRLPQVPKGLAHLVLVDNPVYHPRGDFGLVEDRVQERTATALTFSNVGLYRPELFADCQPGKFRLGTVLQEAISRQQVTGEYYRGVWHNVGTLEEMERVLTHRLIPSH